MKYIISFLFVHCLLSINCLFAEEKNGEKFSLLKAIELDGTDSVWIFYDKRGYVRAKGPCKSGKMTGLWTFFYTEGDTFATGKFTSASESKWEFDTRLGHLGIFYGDPLQDIPTEGRDSVWTFYDESGKINRKFLYRNGKLTGKAQFFYYNGKIYAEEDFDKGDFAYYLTNGKKFLEGNYKKSGNIVIRHEDSTIQMIGTIQGGKKEGNWISINRWKEIEIIPYKNGLANGAAKKIDEDGSVIWEANFQEGKHWGNFIEYNPASHRKIMERVMDNNVFAHFICYDNRGKKIREMLYETPESHQYVKLYYSDGSLQTEYALLNEIYSEDFYKQDHTFWVYDSWMAESDFLYEWDRPERQYWQYWTIDGKQILHNGEGKVPEYLFSEMFEMIDAIPITESPDNHDNLYSLSQAHEHKGKEIPSFEQLNRSLQEKMDTFIANGDLQVRTEYTIHKGRENGWACTFYKNGALKSKQFFKDGKPCGKYIVYYPNGALAAEGVQMLSDSEEITRKIRVKHWTFYHPNGKKAAEGKYRTSFSEEGNRAKSGEKMGLWKYYDTDGKKLYEEK